MNNKWVVRVLWFILLMLSHMMCIIVSYNYASLKYCMECSAPPYVAFILGLPMLLGIAVCIILLLYFRWCDAKKSKTDNADN